MAGEVISFEIQLSMALSVFCVALDATPGALRWLFRRPSLLVRTLLAMFVIMPLFAIALVGAFELRRGLEVALVTLALSPVPPVLPRKEIKAGATSAYVVSLTAVTALVAVVFVPAAVHLLGWALGRSLDVPTGPLVKIVVTSLLLPLVAGTALRQLAPGFAQRLSKPLALGAGVLLLVALLPMLFTARHALLAQIGNFTLAAIAAFVMAGLAVGHVLGGPDGGDRTDLALATATRHPAVAIAIAHAIAPGEKTVPAAVILYLLAGAMFSIPYSKWRTKRASAAVPRSAA